MKHYNFYNKVKTLALATTLAATGAGMMSSCGDFLEIEPQNEITLDKFWNEKTDVEQIIAGCYSGMQSYGMLSRMMIWGEFRSENVINNGPIEKDVDLERLLKENITASNGYTDWAEFYGIINRCNIVINYAPKVAGKDPSYTTSQLNAHIAEVTALRALCYFYLIRTFRDVPYSEQAYLDDSQEAALPATPFDQVLSKLIESLENVVGQAQVEYPESEVTSTYNYNCNRITQNAIYAMLCEMYLWKQDYDNCVKYADLIIEAKKKKAKELGYKESDFSDFYNYPIEGTKYKSLSNSYGSAFNSIFVVGNSMESIFELGFIKGSGGNMISNGPANNFYGGQNRTAWVKQSSRVGLDVAQNSLEVFAKENAGLDARAIENFYYQGETPVSICKNTCMGVMLLSGSNTFSDFIKKSAWGVQYDTYGNEHESRNKSNFIIYRLTDIMLLKAEALAQMMKDPDEIAALGEAEQAEAKNRNVQLASKAFELVDAVNRRSLMEQTYKSTLNASKYNTKKEMTNLVYEERHRELMFEGKRFFDLVRRSQREGNTDYLVSKVKEKSSDLKTIIESKMQKMDAIYWPYNINEMKVNPNLKQNSAFGSGENSSFQGK